MKKLLATFQAEVWIIVTRTPGSDGVIDEKYNPYKRLSIGAHSL